MKSRKLLLSILVCYSFLLAYDKDDLADLKKEHSCVGCDLKDANLSGMNLKGADISESDLSGVILEKANCYSANFDGAKLINTNARLANFKKANLSNVVAKGFVLKGAIVTYTKIVDANFSEARLWHLYLTKTINLSSTEYHSHNFKRFFIGNVTFLQD